MPTKAATKKVAKTTDQTERVMIDELEDGDTIMIEDKWRVFALASESLTVRHHVNIMVKNTNKRFFRVKEDEKIERKVREG